MRELRGVRGYVPVGGAGGQVDFEVRDADGVDEVDLFLLRDGVRGERGDARGADYHGEAVAGGAEQSRAYVREGAICVRLCVCG